VRTHIEVSQSLPKSRPLLNNMLWNLDEQNLVKDLHSKSIHCSQDSRDKDLHFLMGDQVERSKVQPREILKYLFIYKNAEKKEKKRKKKEKRKNLAEIGLPFEAPVSW